MIKYYRLQGKPYHNFVFRMDGPHFVFCAFNHYVKIDVLQHVYRRDEDGGYRVLNIPAAMSDDPGARCGHEYDCCGCAFIAWQRRGLLGLWSVTQIRRNY